MTTPEFPETLPGPAFAAYTIEDFNAGLYASEEANLSLAVHGFERVRISPDAIVVFGEDGTEALRFENKAFYVNGEKVNDDPQGLYGSMVALRDHLLATRR